MAARETRIVTGAASAQSGSDQRHLTQALPCAVGDPATVTVTASGTFTVAGDAGPAWRADLTCQWAPAGPASPSANPPTLRPLGLWPACPRA